jgi:hypothetical protein
MFLSARIGENSRNKAKIMQTVSISSTHGTILFHLGNPDSPAQRKHHVADPNKKHRNEKAINVIDEDPDEEEEKERRRKAEEAHPDETVEQE